MIYEIFDTFQQDTHDATYPDAERAIPNAFNALSQYIADHIDPELEVGDTETYRFNVKRHDDNIFHIWVSGMEDQTLMIVRPKTERTVADLY